MTEDLKEEKKPCVSVVIPVYNSAKFLSEAIDSIVNQTLQDIEIICVYDKSNDESLEILQQYAQKDNRVRVIINEEKKGIGYALNLGLDAAKGKYIARMDADDISVLTRLKKQFDFMEKHKDIGVCGSFIKKFGDVNRTVHCPVDSEEIKVNMIFNCCMMHPTVMFNKDMLEKYNLRYNDEYRVCEDYDMWVRCIRYFKFYNIPEPLLNYREHCENISKKQNQSINPLAIALTKKQLDQYLDIELSVDEINILFDVENKDFSKLYDLYCRLLQAIKQDEINKKLFKKYLAKAIIRKLKKCFKKDKNAFSLLRMFRYNFFSALIYTLTHFYKIKRLK